MELQTPLAERLRPKTFEDYIGQKHLLGVDKSISKMVENKVVPSMILWGPPGSGKTTLAELIAQEVDRNCYKLTAIQAGVKDLREIIQKSKSNTFFNQKPIVFIDEIHRFNKGQQDALLEAVEKGWISLIGATTENPSFEINNALLSRCQVFVLKELELEDLQEIVKRALIKDKWLNSKNFTIKEWDALLGYSGGDARKLLSNLEVLGQQLEDKSYVTNELVKSTLQNNPLLFDKDGEMHYDIISAFIKSIRGSDPQAGVYWLARMIAGGEDPKFIARRLLILASEDIGNANPTALVIANNTFSAVEKIGWPESRIILSQCVVYLANSPKSNATYMAINKAQQLVEQTGNLPVPMHLRNAPTKLMKDLDYGMGYKYSHDYSGNFVVQDFLPEEIKNTTFYTPQDNPRELADKDWMQKRWGKKE